MAGKGENDLWGTIETEVEIEGSAEDFHHMFTHKPHHISNVSSDKIQSCELHGGEWGQVGSIVFWNYHHDGKPCVAKERVEAVDQEKNMISFRVLEGDLMAHYESFLITITGRSNPENPKRCIVHWHFEFKKHHHEIIDPHTLLEFAIDLSKDIEAHIREDKALEELETEKISGMEAKDLFGTIETEVEIEGSAEDFHHMFTHKPHHISNVSSDKIQSCELHDGEWGQVGSIVFWNYHHDGKPCVAKERVEAVDPEKNMISFRVLEGDLMDHYKSFLITITARSNPENPKRCIVHWHLEFEKIHHEIIDPHTLLQFTVDVSKDIEAHIREDKALEELETEQISGMEAKDLFGTIETEVEIEGSAEDFHHMFTHKPHHISNVSSDKIQSCELHDGEWGQVGSIVFWNYHHDGKPCVAKERVEAVDPEKNMISFRVIEGDLMDHYKSFLITITARSNPENPKRCIVHWHLEFEKLHHEIIDPHTLLQFTVDVSKDIEAHIREDKEFEATHPICAA